MEGVGWVAVRWVAVLVRSAVSPCLNLSSMLPSEHLPNLPHRQFIALRRNNLSIRVWVLAVAVPVSGVDCAVRWICVLNPAVVVVGYKPILI
jgi:hypothetical protein